MQNGSSISTSFVLLGLVEMERQKYLFFVFSSIFYLFILTINGIVAFVVLKEESLHEPMYMFIASLLLNEIFGASSIYPKLIIDLITSSKTISRNGCHLQVFCFSTFAIFETSIFTAMAYDRYLAVCHPLQYVTLMTKDRALKVISLCLITTLTFIFITVALAWNLPLCGDYINNIFCDNMSLVVLSCVDTSTSRGYSAAMSSVYLIVTILVTAFSYMKIFMVSLRISGESRQKAVHTVVTHLLNYSIFLVGMLFVFLRYRLETITFPVTGHVLFSVTPLVFPPLCNPLIYGIRTHALKKKVTLYLGQLSYIETWKRSHLF